jgi:hypothetical protein
MPDLTIEEFGIELPESDRSILRELAARVAELAALPANREKKELWRRVNDLDQVRPVVLVRNSEVPWHEMDTDGELQLRTSHLFTQSMEADLRRTLYQWERMKCDMVVDATLISPFCIADTGVGLETRETTIEQAEGSLIQSHRYEAQIESESDIEKIQIPRVSHLEDLSRQFYELRCALVGDILDVRMRGYRFVYVSLWDQLVEWWEPEQVLMDLVMRPELVHMAMGRLTDAWLARLDQYEQLNLLAYDEGNYDVGSGGLGFTGELPGDGFNPDHVRARDQWGFGTAQLFTDVSPQMHEEFALQYEKRWMERFGLTYYGCCDKLHNKIHLLEAIPNLRKISISPWADVQKAAEQIGDRYVMSIKPNPAILATDTWDVDAARKDLKRSLEQSQGCNVELIMKDISTVRYEPQRLWEWAAMASELVERS